MDPKVFERLAEDSAPVRINGSLLILNKTFKYLNDPKCKEMEIPVLKFLIRGLGSCKESTRKGCYSTLIGILSYVPSHVTFNEFVNIVERELSCACNLSQEEEEGIFAGAILAYGSFIHANILLNETKENRKVVVDKLFDLFSKHTSLKPVAYFFLIKMLSQVTEELFIDEIKRCLKNDLKKSKDCFSLDQLYCLCLLKERFQSTKLIKIVSGTNDLINENSMLLITNALLNVPTTSFSTHPFYDHFCSQLVLNEQLLHLYWRNINRQLKAGTHIKECIVLEILYGLLCYLTKDLIKQVPSLMRKQVINLILKKKHIHSDLIKKNLERLESCIRTANNDVKLLFIKKLLFYPGNLNFDCLSGSRIVKTVTNNLDAEGVMLLSDTYCDVLCGRINKKSGNKKIGGSNAEWTNKDIRLVAILYGKLILHASCYTNIEWRRDQLNKLIQLGFFKSNENINADCAGIIRNVFFGNINHKFPRMQDHIDVLTAVINKIDENLNSGVSSYVSFQSKILNVWKSALNKALSLTSSDEKTNFHYGQAFQVIILHMALMLWKDPVAGRNSLQDLYVIIDRITSKNSKKGPHWSEVLVDLLLQLLSSNNNVYRNVVRCVFKNICKDLTQNAVHQILKVLSPEFKLEDLNNENIEEISSNIIDFNNGDEENYETDNSNDDCSDDDDDGDNDKQNLKTFTASFDHIAANSDNESIDMDNLNEDEGELLNLTLSQLFKAQVATKEKKKTNFEDPLTHFRVRVLDLIEILFENCPTLEIVLDVLPSLFDLLEKCIKQRKQEALYSRLRGCFSKLSNVKKHAGLEDLNEILVNKLKNLLGKNNRSTPVLVAMTPQIVDCYKYFFKLSASDNFNSACITQILSDGLNSFYEPKNSTLIFNIIKAAITVTWEGVISLMPHITTLAFSNDVKLYKRYDLIILIEAFFKNNRFFNDIMLTKHVAQFDLMKDIMNQQAIEVFRRIEKKEAFIKFDSALLDILCTLHRSNCFDLKWDVIRTFLRNSIPSSSIAKALKKKVKKLCQLLNVDLIKNLNAEIPTQNTTNLEPVANTFNAGKRKKNDERLSSKKTKKV